MKNKKIITKSLILALGIGVLSPVAESTIGHINVNANPFVSEAYAAGEKINMSDGRVMEVVQEPTVQYLTPFIRTMNGLKIKISGFKGGDEIKLFNDFNLVNSKDESEKSSYSISILPPNKEIKDSKSGNIIGKTNSDGYIMLNNEIEKYENVEISIENAQYNVAALYTLNKLEPVEPLSTKFSIVVKNSDGKVLENTTLTDVDILSKNIKYDGYVGDAKKIFSRGRSEVLGTKDDRYLISREVYFNLKENFKKGDTFQMKLNVPNGVELEKDFVKESLSAVSIGKSYFHQSDIDKSIRQRVVEREDDGNSISNFNFDIKFSSISNQDGSGKTYVWNVTNNGEDLKSDSVSFTLNEYNAWYNIKDIKYNEQEGRLNIINDLAVINADSIYNESKENKLVSNSVLSTIQTKLGAFSAEGRLLSENAPIGGEVETKLNVPVAPESLIKNKEVLPKGTTYEFKKQPDVSSAGTKQVVIVAKYPDGTVKEANATIKVIPVEEVKTFSKEYKGDSSLEFNVKETITDGKNGKILNKGRDQFDIIEEPINEIIGVGNVKIVEEELDYKTIKKNDPTLEEGKTKIETEGKKGSVKKELTYEVNKETGELGKYTEKEISRVEPVNKVVRVGVKKTTINKNPIKAKVVYESDDSLDFEEKKVIKEPVDGEEEITTVSVPGQEDVITKKTLKDPEDGLTKVGNKKVETKTNEDGSTTTTTTIYDVNPDTGELENPKSTSKTTMPATPIEDIAKTTKITNEVIKAKIQYEADDTLGFEENKVIKTPVDGEKEITTVSQSGKEDIVTEKTLKDPEDGLTKVGNKKVKTKTNKDGSVTTTTTIYDVNPDTGELENPKSTSKTTMPATPIEDIAKTTKITNKVIKAKIQYEADDTLGFEENKVIKTPVDGEKEITTVSQSGKEDIVTEKTLKDPEDGLTKVGNKKVETKTNEDGSTTTTTTIYDVDPNTGELTNPQTTSETTMPATPIEDIAKTTKTAKEIIKAKVVYESDNSLTFEEKKVIKTPVDGEKEITTVSQSGEEDVVTEKVLKDPEDGLTKVGNKKVETKTNEDGSTTTTTTIYDVDPNTGELTNPQTTSETTMPATPIEDIAKTTKITNEVIKAKIQYEADDTLGFEENKVIKTPVDGEKEITTVSQSGEEDVVTEKVLKDPEDGLTKVGNKKVETKTNEDGSTTTTTTIYDVNPDTGELENPKSTSITNKVIKAKVVYESDDSLDFEEKKVIKEPVDGEEEITIISIPGQEDVITKKTLKDPEDGLTKVGNKKVETKTNEDGSTTTTTTIYDVNPDTGELENPKSTSTTVKKPQNELYEPEGADQTTDVNKPLNPEDFITNIKDLPEGTEFEFKEQPDFKKPGEHRVVIVATYPDGTKDTVENKLIVKDIEKPITSNKINVTPNTIKPTTTGNVKAQTGGGVGAIGGLIAGLTAAASSIFRRRKK